MGSGYPASIRSSRARRDAHRNVILPPTHHLVVFRVYEQRESIWISALVLELDPDEASRLPNDRRGTLSVERVVRRNVADDPAGLNLAPGQGERRGGSTTVHLGIDRPCTCR
jgi:hypothetical protein